MAGDRRDEDTDNDAQLMVHDLLTDSYFEQANSGEEGRFQRSLEYKSG
jgi:hypothetical protein